MIYKSLWIFLQDLDKVVTWLISLWFYNKLMWQSIYWVYIDEMSWICGDGYCRRPILSGLFCSFKYQKYVNCRFALIIFVPYLSLNVTLCRFISCLVFRIYLRQVSFYLINYVLQLIVFLFNYVLWLIVFV